MKTTQITHKYVLAFLFTSLALQGCGGSKSGLPANNNENGEEIFTEADPTEQAQLEADNEEFSLRRRLVRVNLNLLKRILSSSERPSTLKLNLFNDKKIEVTIEEVDKVSDENFVVVGRILGDPLSSVTLVMNEGVLVANIKRGDSDESYEVRYVGGLHSVRIPDPDKTPTEDCQPIELGPDEAAPEEPLTNVGEDQAAPFATPVIDMLVAYTPRARYYQGGTTAIKALIQMGIADTNTAFKYSGVNLQVRLVGTLETKNNESSSISNDLYALRSKTDSRFNEVHSERTRVGADQVTLVAAYKGISTAAGIGFVRATASSAFTVVKAYYFNQYTFTHELGHNIGLGHSDGYENTSGRFRTIMAYGKYTRIRRYSNPSHTYNGYRTGTSYNNSASILNSRGGYTSSLYTMKVPLTTTP